MTEMNFEGKAAPKTISFFIDEVQYTIACTLSAGDFMRIVRFCEDAQSNYRELLVQIVSQKIRFGPNAESPIIEQIPVLPDAVLNEYISAVLERNSTLQDSYDQCSEISNHYERFAKAVEKYAADNIANAFKSIDFDPAMAKLAEQRHQLQEIAEKVIGPALRSIAQYTKSIVEESIGSVSTALKNLGKFALQIKTPSLTEDEKKELLSSYEKWGEYGWTMAPEMLFGFFDEPPVDRRTANKDALRFCTNRDMEDLFNKLRAMEGVKQKDLEEAIFDFEHRKYKSCIMLLYSLIDAKLIRLQKDEDRQKKAKNSRGKGIRPSGAAAAENIIKRIRDLPCEQQNFYVALMCANLLSCMKELFKKGDDFICQPNEANRQFVSHGMLTRSVKRMDCVKVFLLYYNLLQLLSWKL